MDIEKIKKIIRPYFYRRIVWPITVRHHQSTIRRIRRKGYANVVFLAYNLPMWHLQGVYDLMKDDKRFRLSIVIGAMADYNPQLVQKDMEKLRTYFDSLHIPYLDASKWEDKQCNLKTTLKPDIMFYPQHYPIVFGNHLDSQHYYKLLLCYLPYAASTITEWWSMNTGYLNRAWKLFYETEYNKAEAQRFMHIRGKNVVVVGNSDADLFIGGTYKDVWKSQDFRKKRIIWAPHWTIDQELLSRGSFLWLYEEMLALAKKYRDTIQIAFKPHPLLKTSLYDFPGWGKEKTDAYYTKWQNLENGQLEEGSYDNLFMTSDAMIHDCGSFTVQYHFSHHPVLFTSQKFEEMRDQLNEMGRAALDAHYVGKDINEVEQFITQTILGNIDPKKPDREAFFQKYLLPPHGKTVAQNVYDDIVASLFG